jgi:hypothetical protein
MHSSYRDNWEEGFIENDNDYLIETERNTFQLQEQFNRFHNENNDNNDNGDHHNNNDNNNNNNNNNDNNRYHHNNNDNNHDIVHGNDDGDTNDDNDDNINSHGNNNSNSTHNTAGNLIGRGNNDEEDICEGSNFDPIYVVPLGTKTLVSNLGLTNNCDTDIHNVSTDIPYVPRSPDAPYNSSFC